MFYWYSCFQGWRVSVLLVFLLSRLEGKCFTGILELNLPTMLLIAYPYYYGLIVVYRNY